MITIAVKLAFYLSIILMCLKVLFPETKGPKFIKRPSAQRLGAYIGELLLSFQNLESGSKSVPKYKFYTELVQRLMVFRQLKGAQVSESLRGLRKQVTNDFQFERRLRSEEQKSLMQFLILKTLTWSFILMSYWQLRILFSWKFYVLLLGWQFMGIGLFYFFQKRKNQKLFYFYPMFIKTLFTLKSLMGIESFSRVLELSEFSLIKNPDLRFHYCYEELIKLLKKHQSNGVSIKEGLDEIHEEILYLWEEDFKAFISYTMKMKLLVLICFYLVTYFIYLFALFQKLLP